jgi:hypothetical protein
MSKFGQRIRAITLSSIFLLLPACQIITEQADKNESYGEYYLALQQLSEQQLSQEVLKQQASIDSEATTTTESSYDQQIKLLILYSLPASPIYNSFNAKALLNQMKNEGDNAAFATINPSEQAFITLLRDQLNQRLLMRNRLLTQQQVQQKRALKQQQQLLEQVQLLEQTIKQLKNIEQAIDKRDQ